MFGRVLQDNSWSNSDTDEWENWSKSGLKKPPMIDSLIDRFNGRHEFRPCLALKAAWTLAENQSEFVSLCLPSWPPFATRLINIFQARFVCKQAAPLLFVVYCLDNRAECTFAYNNLIKTGTFRSCYCTIITFASLITTQIKWNKLNKGHIEDNLWWWWLWSSQSEKYTDLSSNVESM